MILMAEGWIPRLLERIARSPRDRAEHIIAIGDGPAKPCSVLVESLYNQFQADPTEQQFRRTGPIPPPPARFPGWLDKQGWELVITDDFVNVKRK